eukprot:15357232-Ditylum_brightwellii.AAC.1
MMHDRENWRQIIHINTAKDVKDILTNLILIDEQDLKGARLKCYQEEATAAKNITYQLSLNNLPENLTELGFDVDKFCNYAAERLKTL